MSRQEEEAGILSWRDFLFREKYRGVFFFVLFFYPIPVSAWIYGWFCEWYHCCTMRFSLRFMYIPVVDLVLFFPLTLVLIEVKKQFHSSSAAVCFPPFGYYLVCRGGSDVYFSNILRSLCLLFCVLSPSSLVLLLTRRVRDSFDGTLVTSLVMC